LVLAAALGTGFGCYTADNTVEKIKRFGCVEYHVVSCLCVVMSFRLTDRARGVPLAIVLVAASGTGISCYTADNIGKI